MRNVLLVLALLVASVFAATSTTTTLVLVDTNLQYQQKPTLRATVSPSTATGNVSFTIDSNAYGTCTLSSGTCQFVGTSGAPLTVGAHRAVATYTGDSNNAGSASSELSFNVLAVTVLSVTSSPSGDIQGNVPVTLTVNTQNQGTTNPPSSLFTFVDTAHNSTQLGQCRITSGTSCSITLSSGFAPNANYTVVANYPGDSVYSAAASPSLTIRVGTSVTTTAATTATSTSAAATSTTAAASSTSTSTSTAASTSSNMTTSATSSSTSTTGARATTSGTSSTAKASTTTTGTRATTSSTSTNKATTTSTSARPASSGAGSIAAAFTLVALFTML